MTISWVALALGVIGGVVFGYRLWRVRGVDQAALRTRLDVLTLIVCTAGITCGAIGLVLAA